MWCTWKLAQADNSSDRHTSKKRSGAHLCLANCCTTAKFAVAQKDPTTTPASTCRLPVELSAQISS